VANGDADWDFGSHFRFMQIRKYTNLNYFNTVILGKMKSDPYVTQSDPYMVISDQSYGLICDPNEVPTGILEATLSLCKLGNT
jgi:hypothetical protein